MNTNMTTTIEQPRRGIEVPPGLPVPEIENDLTRREFLIGAGLIALAPGCGGDAGNGESESGRRTVEHAMGETEVPESPERIVDLDGLATDTMLALRRRPVGVPSPETLPSYVRERLGGAESIGSSEEPNLERIAALEPDLILARQFDAEQVYGELSQIAPTVAAVYETDEDWKQAHLKFSEALGEAEEGERVLAEYERRARELGDTFRGEDIEVSIVRPRSDVVRLYTGASFAGTVIRDAGLSVAPVPGVGEGEVLLDTSRERLDLAEADAVFVWAYEGTPQDEEETIDELLNDPLFQRLEVVRREEVYEVGKHWLGLGPLAANLVLDDIEKHLVEGR